jgi:hypothetical protein
MLALVIAVIVTIFFAVWAYITTSQNSNLLKENEEKGAEIKSLQDKNSQLIELAIRQNPEILLQYIMDGKIKIEVTP